VLPWLLTAPTMVFAFTGIDGFRFGDEFPFAIYACADGYVGVSILTQAHWERLCQLIGRTDLLHDARFRTGAERAVPEVTREIDEMIATFVADKPSQRLFEDAQARGVPINPVPSPRQVLASPQYAARRYWIDYADRELGP